jgi:hypothetical protein
MILEQSGNLLNFIDSLQRMEKFSLHFSQFLISSIYLLIVLNFNLFFYYKLLLLKQLTFVVFRKFEFIGKIQ